MLTRALTPNEWIDPKDDLAATIRDVARLGEVDIQVLAILEQTFQKIYGTHANLGTNQYSEHINDLTNAINKARMHPDDFYGTCLKLSGFGLATEDRPTIRANGERCFRATRRGLALLADLRAFAEKK